VVSWEADLPEGPVTIMFTDVVGSTALRTTLGDQEADELFRAHDALVRAQITENHGHDQNAALGDGFLAVFSSTRRAITAAVGIQRSIEAFNRSRTGTPIRVRVGLNTGEVSWQDGQPYGEAVHAASRVCSAANGGQILVSDVTRQLAGTVPDTSFLDTGEHDLKGFPHPWRLWEVVWIRETAQLPRQVFVARNAELTFLRGKLEEALDGRGSFVLVGGEPGVGKTTLVRELIREAESRGALALFGRCYEIEGALPYSPFVEMLEKAFSAMPAEMVREDMGDDAPEVARMVPELRNRFPDIPSPMELPPEQQRRYFFNAVGSFVARSAKRFPLVLVMDDVHWADIPTLLLIEHMADLVPAMRVLGIGTYRDVELDVSRPLAATMERMVRARTVERLAVKRFGRDDVGRMIRALSGRTPPDTFVEVVFDETEGNPFFVEEVFRHLVEEGKVFDADGAFRTDVHVAELDVPESVRLVVGRRLDRLGVDARKALAAGAVVGRGFSFSLLEAITDADPGRLLDIVEDAEEARVIVPEERDGEIHYSFAHELIRQTLLASLSMLRRQRLHLAVADAMERLYKDSALLRPSEVAAHLMQAGAAADTARTLDYLERATDQAMESAAFEEALRAIEDALAIVDDHDRLRRARLRERQGRAIQIFGRLDECLDILNEVVDTYAEHGQDEAAGDVCWQIAYHQIWLNRFTDAFATYARGLQILGDRQVPIKASLLGAAGGLIGFAGAYAEGTAQLAEATELAGESGDDRTLGQLLWGRSFVDWSFGLVAESCDVGRRAVLHSRSARDGWTLIDALAWLSYPLTCSGRLEEAGQAAAEALELSLKLGHRGGEILARRGVALERGPRTGDLREIESAIREDLQLCLSLNSPWSSMSHAWLCNVLTQRGEIEEALSHADEAIRLEPISAWSGLGWASRLANRAYAGERDEVEAMLAEKVDELREVPAPPAPMGRRHMLMAAAEAAALLGLRDVARSLYPAVVGQVGTVLMAAFDYMTSQRAAGMVAATIGEWDRADEHLRLALEDARVLPNLVDEPMIHYARAKMLLDRGDASDRSAAQDLLQTAVADFRRNGATLRERLAQQLLDEM
jgi:class 3 adenylate cyclase/tetratricopeptide (TPR) repeat protein